MLLRYYRYARPTSKRVHLRLAAATEVREQRVEAARGAPLRGIPLKHAELLLR